jgi:DnaJ-domain-containing protein 1
MESFFDKVALGLNHVQVITRGMYAVAQCDGVHQTELVLLKEFYEGCRREVDGLSSFEEVIRIEFDAANSKEILDTPVLREVFLKSCLLLAYADGVFSDSERERVKGFAKALDVDDALRENLEEQVRDHLLQQVAHIRNLEVLQEVARELG